MQAQQKFSNEDETRWVICGSPMWVHADEPWELQMNTKACCEGANGAANMLLRFGGLGLRLALHRDFGTTPGDHSFYRSDLQSHGQPQHPKPPDPTADCRPVKRPSSDSPCRHTTMPTRTPAVSNKARSVRICLKCTWLGLRSANPRAPVNIAKDAMCSVADDDQVWEVRMAV